MRNFIFSIRANKRSTFIDGKSIVDNYLIRSKIFSFVVLNNYKNFSFVTNPLFLRRGNFKLLNTISYEKNNLLSQITGRLRLISIV